jgi:hypothetical protein
LFTADESCHQKTGHYHWTRELHFQKRHAAFPVPIKRWRSKMKAMIAAFALLFLAVSPTFAASSQTLHFRGDAYVPQSGYLGGADTSRESQIRAF